MTITRKKLIERGHADLLKKLHKGELHLLVCSTTDKQPNKKIEIVPDVCALCGVVIYVSKDNIPTAEKMGMIYGCLKCALSLREYSDQVNAMVGGEIMEIPEGKEAIKSLLDPEKMN